MELDERKLRILQRIIDDYILTGMPVGSRTISKHGDINLSSATIRNEMSDLEEMGYLGQPHSSAGRIPSDKAYRLYVDNMIKHSALTQQELSDIRSHVTKRIDEVEEVISQTANVLANMTQYPSIVMAPEMKGATIKHVQLVPVADGRALAVIVTKAGTVYDMLMRVPQGYAADELEKLSRLLTERLQSLTTIEAVKAIENEMSRDMGDYRNFFNSIADAISNNVSKKADKFIALGGATNLLIHPEYSDITKARAMLNLLETKDNLYKILRRRASMEFTVTIGTENEFEEMRDSSVVTATYKIGDLSFGSFGVIGPSRMNYSKIFAVLDGISQCLGEVLTGIIVDGNKEE